MCSSRFSTPTITTATTQPGVMPTALERGGDFSQSDDASGQSVQIIDPATGSRFPAT